MGFGRGRWAGGFHVPMRLQSRLLRSRERTLCVLNVCCISKRVPEASVDARRAIDDESTHHSR